MRLRQPLPLGTLRKVCGAFLVLAALSGVALADMPLGTPEIDPGSLLSAMTLLTGGVLMVTDRRRRRK